MTAISNAYCTYEEVKDRLLITASDDSYNSSIAAAAVESSRLVDIFLMPYVTTPLTGNDLTDQVAAITADFTASVFKRRMFPEEMKVRGPMEPTQLDTIDATGWFAMAVSKIERYIRNKFILKDTVIGNTAHNPDTYVLLLEKGLITGKEARGFINNATTIALKRSEDISKTTVEVSDETVVRDITERAGLYKKQKSFSFISGKDFDSGGYELEGFQGLEGNYSKWSIYDSFDDANIAKYNFYQYGVCNKNETIILLIDGADLGARKYTIATKTLGAFQSNYFFGAFGMPASEGNTVSIQGTYVVALVYDVSGNDGIVIWKNGDLIKTITAADLGFNTNEVYGVSISKSGKYIVVSGTRTATGNTGWVVLVGD